MDFNFSGMSRSIANRLTVRSALNPVLWLVGLFGLPCLFLLVLFVPSTDAILRTALMVWISIVLLLPVGLAAGFAYWKPQLLQSEDYQTRHQVLQMLQGTNEPLVVNALTAIVSNPGATALVEGTVADADIVGEEK